MCRIDVQSFILLSISAHYFCLPAIICTDTTTFAATTCMITDELIINPKLLYARSRCLFCLEVHNRTLMEYFKSDQYSHNGSHIMINCLYLVYVSEYLLKY